MAKFTRDQIVTRVQALLAKADTNKNPSIEEAAVAAQKAQKLMLEYNIELAEILAKGDVNDDIIDRTIPMGKDQEVRKFDIKAWRIGLMNSVCKVNMCKCLYNGTNFILIGRSVHLDVVEQMYYSLVNQIEVIATKELDEMQRIGVIATNVASGYGVYNRRTYEASFCNGAAYTVCKRLEAEFEAQKKAAENVSVTALVVTTDKLVNDYTENKFHPKTSPISITGSGSSVGSWRGQMAGENINHRRGIEGDNSPKPKRLK